VIENPGGVFYSGKIHEKSSMKYVVVGVICIKLELGVGGLQFVLGLLL